MKYIIEVPDPVKVGGENVKMWKSTIISPPPKKRNVDSIEGNAQDSSSPFSLGYANVKKESSHPPEEMLDVPPIVVSSDESDNEGAEEGNNSVVIISDSEEEQEESYSYEDLDQPENYEDSANATDPQLDLTIKEHRRKIQRFTALRPLARLSREMTAAAKDFQILLLIGAGAFGRVFVVRKSNGYDAGQVYAMKTISKKEAIHSLRAAKRVKSEREILEAIQGTPFIVSLYYAFQDSRYLYLVMDFAQGGELYRRVVTEGGLPMAHVVLYVGELVLGLQYLHDRNIIYRDLKLENILIDNEGHLVLADLGLATILTARNQFRAYNYCGTLNYMAPEVLEVKPEGYGKPVDWWSLGVNIVEMLTVISPFMNTKIPIDQQTADTERRILHEEPQLPESLPFAAVELVKKLLEKDPSRRLADGSKIRWDAFFRDINWTILRRRKYQMPFRPRCSDTDDVQYFDPEITKLPDEVPDHEPAPEDLQVYEGFEYTSQQIIEWLRLLRDESVEYRNPDVERLSPVPDDLLLMSLLNRGAFGTCFLTQQNQMVKVIHSSNFHTSEVDALSTLVHPHIVRYYGSYRKKTEIWIVMEYLSDENLKWWIENGLLNEKVSRKILKQLAKALRYMHKNRFIHGDLKPENVVCADSRLLIFKLVDFGNASYSSSFNQWEGKARYTLDYAPPELLTSNGNAIYSPAVDIYGLGATLYCMVVGHPPYRLSVKDVLNSPEIRGELKMIIGVGEFNINSGKWLTASQEYRDLVTWCLQRDPGARPQVKALSHSKWMKRSSRKRKTASCPSSKS